MTRHDPSSLARLSAARLPGISPVGFPAGSLAPAGPWVWAGDWNGIDRLNSNTGSFAGHTPIPGADGAEVATDDPAPPSELVVSEGSERARIQLRDPLLGSLILQTAPIESVSKPFIGGVLDGRVWLSNAGGLTGTFFALDAHTLRAVPVNRPAQQYTNAVRAEVLAGVLWINQPFGGAQRNYCAAPTNGAPRLPIQALLNATLLTANQGYVYAATSGSAKSSLIRIPVPPGCRSG